MDLGANTHSMIRDNNEIICYKYSISFFLFQSQGMVLNSFGTKSRLTIGEPQMASLLLIFYRDVLLGFVHNDEADEDHQKNSRNDGTDQDYYTSFLTISIFEVANCLN